MSELSSHLAVPEDQRDMAWLHAALQKAIELEHATLPLYLAASFSLETQNYTTYNLLRSVAMEEMVHMAIACNTLTALGGSPRIASLTAPGPGHGLPGGVEPDLEVILASLSKAQIKNFMRLEIPLFLLPEEFKHEAYPSIATLYDAIKAAILRNADAVRAAIQAGGTGNQIGDDIGFRTITADGSDPVDQIIDGIEEVIDQGEGAASRSLHAERFEGEESHYCKFAQIYYGGRYQVPEPPVELTCDSEAEFFKGYPIGWPVIINTLAVPSDGYARLLAADPNGGKIEAQLTKFDRAYTSILENLDAIWNGSPDASGQTFGEAIGGMAGLRVLSSFAFMRQQVPEPLIARLPEFYPDEHEMLARYTRLDEPVFYGPRFRNSAS